MEPLGCEKYRSVLADARDVYDQDPDWVTFFREVLGIEGIVRRAFPDAEALAEFEASPEYEEIQKMLTKLRERRGAPEKKPWVREKGSVISRVISVTEEDSREEIAPFEVDAMELLIDTGSATAEEVSELLVEISRLYQMAGGRGIDFAVVDSRDPVIAEGPR